MLGVLFVVACAETPPAAAPTNASHASRASNCTLEAVLAADAGGARRCGDASGDCDRACRERTRACIFESAAARSPFVAIWNGSYYDGLGRRFAMTGDGAGDSYRIVRYEYTFASGYDSRRGGVKDGASRATIVLRDCSSPLDLRDECGPNGRKRGCDAGGSDREARLEIGCAVNDVRTVCEDSFE
jgi:hypothetical protein